MKKILLVLLTVLSASLLFAAATLDTANSDVSFFNADGYRDTLTALEDGCTAVTGLDNATFSCEFGTFTLGPKTAVRYGYEDSTPYIYLIKGTVELNNTSSSAVLVKTPESVITLPEGGLLNLASDLTEETASVMHVSAVKTDILSGTTSVIPDSYVAPAPVVVEVAVEIAEEVAPVEEAQEVTLEEEPAVVEEVAQEPVEPVTKEPVVVEEVAPVVEEAKQETPVVTETVTGNGFSFGFKLHGDIRDVRLDTTNQYCIKHLKNSIASDSNWYASLYGSFNSLKISLRADRTNINPDSYKFDTTSAKTLIPQILKLASSFVDEVKYGSEGTLFNLRMDRTSDFYFKNTAFGQMDHDFISRGELGFYTSVKTDYVAGSLFADNLSQSQAEYFKCRADQPEALTKTYNTTDISYDPGFNAGLRVSGYVTKSKKIMVSLSSLALTEDFGDFVILPGADLTFNIYGNSKSKLDLSLAGVVDATKNFKNYAGGLCFNFQVGALSADVGADYTHGAYLSRIVDYGNCAYTLANTALNAEHVVNAYADIDLKLNKFYTGLSVNVPVNVMPFAIYDAPVQDTTFKIGADFEKVSIHACAKFTDLVYKLNTLTTVDGIIDYLNDNTEKLSLGADFDLGFSVFSLEANYLDLSADNKIPVSLSMGLTIKYDSKLF